MYLDGFDSDYDVSVEIEMLFSPCYSIRFPHLADITTCPASRLYLVKTLLTCILHRGLLSIEHRTGCL